MLTGGSLSPLCHLTGQRSERCVSVGVGQLLLGRPPPLALEKAKGHFETQRLGTLSGACRDASCTFLPSGHGSSIGWLQPLRLGLHSPQGPGALTPGETDMGGWMGWDGMGRIG